MGNYNICKGKTMYGMGSREAALTALLDLARMPLLYGKAFHVEVYNGSTTDFKSLIETDVFRDCFEQFFAEDAFDRCILKGTSDAEGARRVEIIWDPTINEKALILTFHGGFPVTGAEAEIINAVHDLWPGPPERQHPDRPKRIKPVDDYVESLTDAEKITLMAELERKGRAMDFTNFIRCDEFPEPAGYRCYAFVDVTDSMGSRGERLFAEVGMHFTAIFRTAPDPDERGYTIACYMIRESEMPGFQAAMEVLKDEASKDGIYPIYCQLMLMDIGM